MVKLRQDFRKGVKPEGCRTCWDEESAGVRSYRQEFMDHRVRRRGPIDFDDSRPGHPVTLDLKLSNLCNLRCRICGPVASSSWLKETLDHGTAGAAYLEQLRRDKDFLKSDKISGHQSNLAVLKSWLPHIEHVEMFGGEPFVTDELRDIEELMVSEGTAAGVSLLYNTNITVFRESFVERWRNFRVTICLSLDDIGERFEYQRYPASWDTVRKNVLKYAEINSPPISIFLFCSVSSFNVWYLPEYLRWVKENCPGLPVRFNYVHYDPWFCVTNLPRDAKAAVSAKLLGSPELEAIVSFMNSKDPVPSDWARFVSLRETFDRIRGQSFAKIFPEFTGVLNES
jgi:sulfatase maturation enzyme AslB (radical SAM superfamily)